MDGCYSCGQPYDDSFADWTVCRGCMRHQMEEYHGEPVFMDSLGIVWTQSELQEAGGTHEVMKMAHDADARNNLPRI
jgi:hypothetical protein